MGTTRQILTRLLTHPSHRQVTGTRVKRLENVTVPQLITKFPPILWHPKFHCRVHNGPPTIPVLSQINSLGPILILSFPLRLGIPSSVSFAFPHQTPVRSSLSPTRATCLARLTLHDITHMTFRAKCRSRGSGTLQLHLRSKHLPPKSCQTQPDCEKC